MSTGILDLHWWQRGVVYQVYPRSFKDTTGNGVGDLNGIITKLDYLDNLGVDAIWLSPFFRSPMADFGYDVAGYCDVDPLFGDLAAFDDLLEEAHRRGIKVIIDYVPNHSSDQHPWFIESRRSRDNPKRDWYIWRNPKPDGSPPNNWGSAFGGTAWTLEPATGQYYLHQYLKEQPDLNWRNPEVRAGMMDVLRFWLERGVDGFRMDVVDKILKDRELCDNPLNPDADPNLPPNDLRGRQLLLHSQDQDDVHEIMREFRRLLDKYGDCCAIGEIYLDLPRWVRYYGQKSDELHLPFNFRLIGVPWNAQMVRRSVDELEAALPPEAWPNYVLGNHDRMRLASRLGSPQARTAAMLLLTLRGTPTLYYGDELGMENVAIPPDKIADPPGRILGPERGRDGCRTPMQWNASEYAGFSAAEPWLPVSADYTSRNVTAQAAEPTSILQLYLQLLHYRRQTPALHSGEYLSLDADPDCFVYLRQAAENRCLIALNFVGEQRQVKVPDFGGIGKIALSTYLDREEIVLLSDLRLRPFEGVIIEDPVEKPEV